MPGPLAGITVLDLIRSVQQRFSGYVRKGLFVDRSEY
jgi:hypothetical protein